MAITPKITQITTATRFRAGATQSVVDIAVPRSSDEDIVNVLSSNAKVYITSAQVDGKDVNYQGVVSVQLLYNNADGMVGSAEYSTTFGDKYTLDTEYQGAVAVVSAQVMDVKANIGSSDIRVAVIVESTVDIIHSSNTDVVAAVEGDGVYYKTGEYNYNTYMGTANERLDYTANVTLRGPVSKILSACTTAYIRRVTPYNNYVKVDAGVDVTVTYLKSDDDSTLSTYNCCTETALEATLEGINNTSTIQSVLNVALEDIKVTAVPDGDNTRVDITMPLVYAGYVYNAKSIEVVSDVYSTTNYLSTTTTSVDNIQNILALNTTEKLDGTLSLTDDRPFIDDMLGATCVSVTLSSADIVDGRLVVEGEATVKVLYLNKESSRVYSADVQLPYSVSLSGDFDSNSMASVIVCAGDITARSRRGKDIDVTAVLYVYANTYSEETMAVLSAINVEDEIPESECALSFVVASNGDTLWDIAKRELVDPDMLAEQNSELDLPLSSGDRVVVYRQRMVNFD